MTRALYAVLYLVSLAYNMLKSAVAVAFLSVTGGIDPRVIRVKTKLKKPFSQVILANSITLTPGTLTVDVDSEGRELTVAVLTPREPDSVTPFEKYLRGALE